LELKGGLLPFPRTGCVLHTNNNSIAVPNHRRRAQAVVERAFRGCKFCCEQMVGDSDRTHFERFYSDRSHRSQHATSLVGMSFCRFGSIARAHWFSVKIKMIRALEGDPCFLSSSCCISIVDLKTFYGQNHGARAHLGRRTFSYIAAIRTPNRRRSDLTFAANFLEHSVELDTKTNHFFNRRTPPPFGTQCMNHF
jgi:hypothetical protein